MGKPNVRLFLYFLFTLVKYTQLKIWKLIRSLTFYKRWTVRKLIWRRGQLFRPAAHFGVAALALLAIMGGAAFGPLPSLATQTLSGGIEVVAPQTVVQTEVPQDRPRANVVEHTIVSGETLSTLANQYNVSTETLKWSNGLTSDQVSPGQKIKVLPVTGVEHRVAAGDSLESIAKKYSASAQAIADFPFNDVSFDEVAGKFSLRVGQTVVVPDGRIPEAPKAKPAPRPSTNQAQVPSRPATGGWVWPVGGVISQYFSWYHSGMDIAGPTGTAVVAAQSGRVVKAQNLTVWAGRNVAIDHGGGVVSTYNHLNYFVVQPGQAVSRGQVIGYRGSTGRSTGPHLHFEVMVRGKFVNPLSYLR